MLKNIKYVFGMLIKVQNKYILNQEWEHGEPINQEREHDWPKYFKKNWPKYVKTDLSTSVCCLK